MCVKKICYSNAYSPKTVLDALCYEGKIQSFNRKRKLFFFFPNELIRDQKPHAIIHLLKEQDINFFYGKLEFLELSQTPLDCYHCTVVDLKERI